MKIFQMKFNICHGMELQKSAETNGHGKYTNITTNIGSELYLMLL